MRKLAKWILISFFTIEVIEATKKYDKNIFLENFVKWQTPSIDGSIERCFSISFGFKNDLDILMYEMTLDFDEKSIDRFSIDSTDDCFLVFVGGKYVDMIDQVVTKVEKIRIKVMTKAKVIIMDTNDQRLRKMNEYYPPLVYSNKTFNKPLFNHIKVYYPHFTSVNKYVFNLQCPKQEKKLSLHLYNDATVRGDIHYFDVCKVTDSGMGSKKSR